MIIPTLTQVSIHFSPITLMESYIPRIQDGMRRIGLPHYRSEEGRWVLHSHDEQEMVIITPSSVVFQRFGARDFGEVRAEELFTCFCDETELFEGSLVVRIGVRRLSLIEGGEWKRLLRGPYHGVTFPSSLQVGNLRQYHSLYSQGVTDLGPFGFGNLSIKMLQNGRGVCHPLDIVLLRAEEEREGVFVTIIDIEHVLLTDEISTFGDLLKALADGCDALLSEALTDEGVAH
ncbi:MAG: hypothetical protein RBQ65_00260 [Sphaerochaeta sp.]|nr:hypothetical protein [Sphaerochaeta sp.]